MREMDRQHLGAIPGTPDELGGTWRPLASLCLIHGKGETPPEDEIVDAELTQHLRQLRDIAKLVRCVADVLASPVLSRHRGADEEVTDGSLTAGEVEIVLHVPGPDQDAAFGYGASEQLLPVRTNGEVVLDADALRIEVEHIVR